VTGTEGAVENLATRVDEHDDNVQELAETIDTVTQRGVLSYGKVVLRILHN
jgi:hypothetical protein